MIKSGTIMVVDDNRSILKALELLLNRYFDKVILLSGPNRIHATLREESVDVVLLDMNFSAGINSGNEGFYWMKEIKKHDPDIQVVLFTAYGDIDLAVRAIKEGATDFVVKPWENDKLIATLQMAWNLRRSRREVRRMKEVKRELIPESDFFWGGSPAMAKLQTLVEKVAATDANVLITGENGTGKDMLAHEIHRLSLRKHEIFVAVDVGAIPETLFEGELFGHAKGAFTDAIADRAGKFEVADGGTLFLDEIGNLPIHLQAKLLVALQSRTVIRVGTHTPIPFDIRLITATNRNLNEMIGNGGFREDLLYRLNTIHMELPPLRERRDDIIPLAQRFMNVYASKYGKGRLALTQKAMEKLRNAPWNGNIRELQHAMEKAVIVSEGNVLDESAFNASRPAAGIALNRAAESTLEDMEKTMIRQSIQKHDGNLSAVALQLGITRQTLYNKIKKYGL